MHRLKPFTSILGMILVGCVGLGCSSTKRKTSHHYNLTSRSVSVESLVIEVRDFHGRPDAVVDIRGRLSTNGAILRDVEQYRKNGVIYLKVTESTPIGSIGLREDAPFQKRYPFEVLGLLPGQTYVVKANNAETQFTMPE